jgi:hypothetical protein
MVNNDDLTGKLDTRTLESTPKTEFDVSEVFRGANLKEKDVVDFYQQAVANPLEAKEMLLSQMANYDAQNKQVKELVGNIKYFTEKLDTGFDIRNATRGQKFLYGAASLIPVASWRQSAKEKVANTQKEDIIDNILVALTNLNNLTKTTATLIKAGYSQHGYLRNLADNDFLKQQEKAVKTMDALVPKIVQYSTDLTNIETRINEIKGKEEFKEEYLTQKKELGKLEDTLFIAKQDLVKRTIDYNVAEDCFYQTEIMMDKLKNATAIMDTKNYEVSRSTEQIMKLMPAKMSLHKIVQSGEALVTLKDQLDNILREQELRESEQIKYLAQVVAQDLETRVYAPIQGLQIELNEETRRIIEATQALIVQEAKSGVRQKAVEELKAEVKNRQDETYNGGTLGTSYSK